jgi:hypothetical protein
MRDDQIKEKVQEELDKVLKTLIIRAKQAVPERAHVVDEIAEFLNAERFSNLH